MITGVIPFQSLKEQIRIVKKLQKEYSSKIKLDIQDGMIFYELRRKINHDRFSEF